MKASLSTNTKPSRIRALCRSAAISQANRARAERDGGMQWSASEMRIVLDLYPDYDTILKRLPHRSYSQVRRFAYKYQIAAKRHVWTNKEVERLKTAVRKATSGAEIYDQFPGFTKGQVNSKAKNLRLKWPEPGPKLLGVPILDAVRAEAFRRNLSLSELDEICGGKSYWRKCLRTIDWSKVVAVISYMGGTIGVTWSE